MVAPHKKLELQICRMRGLQDVTPEHLYLSSSHFRIWPEADTIDQTKDYNDARKLTDKYLGGSTPGNERK